MDFSNTKVPSRSFEVTKGQNDEKDGSDLSFRIPSIPNSPSTTMPSQSESVRQRNHEMIGSSNADSWMSTTSHIENQERQPLYPPPLVCLNSPNQQSSEASALDLAIKNRNGSSTSTPIESNKVPSLGGLIRPIPSRLGSPFSPILSSGVGKCPVPSHIMAKNLASSAVNPFSLNVLGNSNVTTTSKLKDAMETRTNNSQKLSLESEVSPKVGSVDDYDSAFEDESIIQQEKESCSRTTPNNHKSIRKWRQHSHPGGVKNRSRPDIINEQKIGDVSNTSNGFFHPSPFQPISIRTSSSTVINETTHTSIPSPFDIDVHRLSPAGPLSAPSTFHWGNPGGSISHHRPNSTGGSTSSSSGCSSFLGGGPFSPNDSLFASPGSNASSSGNVNSISSTSSSSNPSSLFREHDSSIENDQHLYPFPSVRHRQSVQQHKSPIFRRTTTTVLTKTETVTSPEGSVTDESANITEQPIPVALPNINNRTGISLATSSSGTIPVGIAVARQRVSTTIGSVNPSVDRNVGYTSDSAINSVGNVTNNDINVPQNLVKIASQRDNPAENITTPTFNNANEKSSCDNATSNDGILRSLPAAPPYYSPWSQFPYMPGPPNQASAASDNFALQSVAAAATLAAQAGLSPLGGYQIAKDPLTGQVYFVPSAFNAPTQPHHMMWPPSAIATTLHQLSAAAVAAGPPSIPPPPHTYQGAILPHQHHSYLEQLQRETQLISAMARNYQDSSALSSLGLPPLGVPLIQPEKSKTLTESKGTTSQPIQLGFQQSDKREEFDSKSKDPPSQTPSERMYNNVHDTNLNDTKDNNKRHNDNIILKTDPYQDEVSAEKEHKKFQINGTCQMKHNLQIKTKVELTNLQAKQETDFPVNLNVSDLRKVDTLSSRSADDDRVSVGCTTDYLKYKEGSPKVDSTLNADDKHKYNVDGKPNILLDSSSDSNSWQYLKEPELKVENQLSSVKDNISLTINPGQSLKYSVQDQDESKEIGASNHKKRDAVDEGKDLVDADVKPSNTNSINNSSQILTTSQNNKSGLDILAEGVEQLEKKLESSDDLNHFDSRLSSPDLHTFRAHGALLSPLGMLYDAAVLKAEEEEHTTPIKNKRHEELSSDGERINLNTFTGRSRSLDSQTVRKTSRRNSLCISSEFGRGYRSPKAERDVKAYIASKSRRGFSYSANAYTECTKDNANNEKNAFNGVTPLGSLGTKDLLSGLTIDTGGKSSTNMASWENEMRSNLADIQKKYKEKYKELYRLDHQVKRMEARNKKRPSVGKECTAESNLLPNHSKSPIVSPKKHCRTDGNTRNYMNSNPLPPSKPLPLPLHPDILDAHQKAVDQLKEIDDKDSITENAQNNVQLKTYSQLLQGQNNESKVYRDPKQNRSGRIVPIQNFSRPSMAQEHIVVDTSNKATDLSTITSKFKVSKPNPFENLLRLSSRPCVNTKNEGGSSSVKVNHESETLNEVWTQNEKVNEADPIEENIILPITRPIRVKDVVNCNDDPLPNSIAENKVNLKTHYRKRMVETFILKKAKSAIDSNAKQNSSIHPLPISFAKDSMSKEQQCTESHHGREADHIISNATLTNVEHNDGDISPDISVDTKTLSISSQDKIKSNLTLMLKPTMSKYEEHNGIYMRENKLQDEVCDKELAYQTKEEMEKADDLKQSDFNIDEIQEVKQKKNKKDKKNKNKKSKKDKRESKSDKSTRKKMKVVVGRNKQNCMDISDQKEQRFRPAGTSSTTDQHQHDFSFSKSSSMSGAHSCIIKESDLDEGVRVLVKIDGHFHPGKILAIFPPDIYGILVDRERGNRPHIFSREEVLIEAIFEVKPNSLLDLSKGTRVCAYWSEKYHHLFPGTVSEDICEDISDSPKSPKDHNYVNIELDDGDDRAIHIKNIRFLPPNYPIVTCDNDPLASVSRRRRRQSIENFKRSEDTKCSTPRSSIEDVAVEERIAVAKRARYEIEKTEKSPTKTTPNKPTREGKDVPGRLKFTFKTTSASTISHNKRESTSKASLNTLQCSNSSSQGQQNFVKPTVMHASRSKLSRKHTASRQNVITKKVTGNTTDPQHEQSMGMAAFLPAQQLWRWSTKGHKRARGRMLHREIERDEGETLAVGDCAIFLSTGRPDRPYVGRLESLWETSAGQMRVRVQWFYHASETEGTATGGRRVQDLKMPGALFESSHFDENDIQTISHRCEVLPFSTYANKIESDPSRLKTIYENNDLYYLAGQHDPIEGTIQFENDVLANH